MTTRPPRRSKRTSTDRDKPRGKLEALARRQGGHGYSFTPHALFRFSRQLGLKPIDLLVLLAILSHASAKATDFACASYEQLARDTGLDRKTVIKHVDQLKKLDLLTWSNTRKADKTRTPNTYNVQLLAEKLTELVAKAPEPEREQADEFDALLAELVAEVGVDTDHDEPGGVEVPLSSPGKRKGRWATVVKDDDDKPRGHDGRGQRGTAVARSRVSPRGASAPAVEEATPTSPWTPGSSRLRPPELDKADHEQLDRRERLRHPDGRELTVDEHLYRLREMERYSRPRMADILIDLGFPSEEITAAMNAGPVERLRRLSGAASLVQVLERKPDAPRALAMPPNIANDPVAREAWEAIERIRLRRLEKERGGQS